MQKQSIDFIKGYIFSKVENQIMHAHVNKPAKIPPMYVLVPKSWFGLRAIKSELEDLSISARSEILGSLSELFRSYNTLNTTYEFQIFAEPDQQYIRFSIEGILMPTTTKEMTISDIEKELGYKIKIIG